MTSKLGLDPATVREARDLARRAGEPITEMARTHTTVSVERAVLRLAGLDGAGPDGMPWVNRLADAVRDSVGLEHGVALPVWHALETTATWLALLTLLLPVLATTWRRVAIVVAAVILMLVGYSRVALNVHYPSDVLAGWALGYLYFLLCLLIFRPKPALVTTQ